MKEYKRRETAGIQIGEKNKIERMNLANDIRSDTAKVLKAIAPFASINDRDLLLEMDEVIWTRLPMLGLHAEHITINVQFDEATEGFNNVHIINPKDYTVDDATYEALSGLPLGVALTESVASVKHIAQVLDSTKSEMLNSHAYDGGTSSRYEQQDLSYVLKLEWLVNAPLLAIDYLAAHTARAKMTIAEREYLIHTLSRVTAPIKHVYYPYIRGNDSMGDILTVDVDDLIGETTYECHNDVEILSALSEVLILNEVRIRQCPICGSIFIPLAKAQKYCSESCVMIANTRNKMKYQTNAVRKAYKNARDRIVDQPKNKSFRANDFCAENNPHYMVVEKAINEADEQSYLDLTEALHDLFSENMQKMHNPEDSYDEDQMIDWLNNIRAK